MFETSVVREQALVHRRYPLLAMSLAIHSVVVVAVVAVSIHSVSLPKNPPNETLPFVPFAAPPPPVQSPPRATQRPAQPARPLTASKSVAPATPQIVAPSRIPDATPAHVDVARDVQPGSGDATASSNPGPGVADGDPNSVTGDGPATVVPVTPVPDTVFHPGGEVRPATVLHRVEPAFPRAALAIRLAGTVVLRCIVDRSGEVRDAEVVTSSHAAFNEPALAALRQWRFAPGVFRGKPVDTYFELTISFQPR